VISWSSILAATLGVLLVCVALAGVVAAIRIRRHSREARRSRLMAPFRQHLVAVSAGEDPGGDSRRVLADVAGPARRALAESVSGMLGKVRGLPAEQLVEVLASHGALGRAVEDLGHRSPVRRAQAAQLLGLSRDPAAVDPLVGALGDHAAEVRASAAYALGLIGDPRAAGPLLHAVGAPGGGLPAGLAADALLSMGVGISDSLVHGLVDPDPRTRTVTAHLCGAGSFTRALPLLRDLVALDPDLTVRETCATALGRIGRAEDAEVLTRHTQVEHPQPLRRVCAAALGELGDPSAVPTLAALTHDPDPRLAELAASTLVKLGPQGRAALAAGTALRPVRSAVTMARLLGALP